MFFLRSICLSASIILISFSSIAHSAGDFLTDKELNDVQEYCNNLTKAQEYIEEAQNVIQIYLRNHPLVPRTKAERNQNISQNSRRDLYQAYLAVVDLKNEINNVLKQHLEAIEHRNTQALDKLLDSTPSYLVELDKKVHFNFDRTFSLLQKVSTSQLLETISEESTEEAP